MQSKKTQSAAKEVKGKLAKAKVEKQPRTLSLDSSNFKRLKSYCAKQGIPVSEVVDELIAAFLRH
jgi:hypothetical protein